MEEPLVRVIDGTVRFQSFSLNIARLSLGTGIYWLKGQNGSGKTTLLRVILGLQPVHSGSVILNATRLGYLPQNYRDALLPWLTADKNLHLYPQNKSFRDQWSLKLGVRKAELSRASHQLSGGQAQRVALVRETSLLPDLLILDEPFSSLDINSRNVAGEMLQSMITENNTGLLITTHAELPSSLNLDDVKQIEITRTTDEEADVRQV